MMTVAIEPGAPFRASRPRMLFEEQFYQDPGFDLSYDVAPDGRFVMLQQSQQQLRVVFN